MHFFAQASCKKNELERMSCESEKDESVIELKLAVLEAVCAQCEKSEEAILASSEEVLENGLHVLSFSPRVSEMHRKVLMNGDKLVPPEPYKIVILYRPRSHSSGSEYRIENFDFIKH